MVSPLPAKLGNDAVSTVNIRDVLVQSQGYLGEDSAQEYLVALTEVGMKITR